MITYTDECFHASKNPTYIYMMSLYLNERTNFAFHRNYPFQRSEIFLRERRVYYKIVLFTESSDVKDYI